MCEPPRSSVNELGDPVTWLAESASPNSRGYAHMISGAFAGKVDVVAVLHDRAAAESTASAAASARAGAARDRAAGVVVRRVLLAIPHLARRRARLEEPGARAARRAIVLAQQREPLIRVADALVAPLGLRDFRRLTRERRRQRDDAIAERHVVLQIAAVERLHPE